MELLLVCALASHLLLVNLSMTGPLCCVWLDIWARRNHDETIESVGVRLAHWSLAALVVGMLSGALLVLLPWITGDQRLFQVAAKVPGRIVNGVWEILFSLLCLAVYVGWYSRRQHPTILVGWLQRLLAIVASTNLMYHFPPLFTILSQLQCNPHQTADIIDRAAFRAMMLTPEVWAFTFHYWLASLTTSAIVIIVLAAATIDGGGLLHKNVIVVAGRVALAASLLQIPVGVWLLSVLPSPQQTALLGSEPLSTLLLVAGLIATWMLLQQLVTVAWGDFDASPAWHTVGWLILVILLMSGALVRSRRMGQQPLRTDESVTFHGPELYKKRPGDSARPMFVKLAAATILRSFPLQPAVDDS